MNYHFYYCILKMSWNRLLKIKPEFSTRLLLEITISLIKRNRFWAGRRPFMKAVIFLFKYILISK